MKAIAVIGQPRCGSTIICSYLNSLPKAMVFGEPHRTGRSQEFNTRYGKLFLDFQNENLDALEQMRLFAYGHNLNVYGFKEVWDYHLNFNPIQLVNKYGARLDYVFVPVRDPRKQWSSISALGFRKDLSIDTFIRDYIHLCDLCHIDSRYRPLVLEKFMKNPSEHIYEVTGWRAKKSFNKQQFTGGGDPFAMKATKIKDHDDRISFPGPRLNSAGNAYRSIIDYMRE